MPGIITPSWYLTTIDNLFQERQVALLWAGRPETEDRRNMPRDFEQMTYLTSLGIVAFGTDQKQISGDKPLLSSAHYSP